MNDTTVIGSAEQVEDVRAYVRAVRAWLGDLPADEVEDLTAGMEADLAERAAESGGPLGGLLGQPEAYAAELRSAAGLPPRVDVVAVPDAVRARAVDRPPGARRARARGPASVAARAATDLVAGPGCRRRMGRSPRCSAPGARCCSPWSVRRCRCGWAWSCGVGSRWAPGVRFALGVGNALAVVLLLPMLASYTSGSSGYSDEAALQHARLPVAGRRQRGAGQNLYAYDAAGQPAGRCAGVRPVRPARSCRRPRRRDGGGRRPDVPSAPTPAAGRRAPSCSRSTRPGPTRGRTQDSAGPRR